MEDLDKFWSLIENELYCKVPQYLKVLLKLQGFDSVIAIKKLDDADIQYSDSFVRKQGYDSMCQCLEFKDYYHHYLHNRENRHVFENEFEVLRGHKKLLKAIAEFVMQQVDSNGIDVFVARCLNFDHTEQKKTQGNLIGFSKFQMLQCCLYLSQLSHRRQCQSIQIQFLKIQFYS